MRRMLLALSAAAIALSGAAVAQAQPLAGMPGVVLIDDDDDWDDWRDDQRDRAKELRKAERDYAKAQRKYAKAQRRYARGQYLPAQYRSQRYVIQDYRAYRLPPPPRGYAYVRYDDDILLTGLASGLITRVLTGALGY
ncbi:MAG TPA: RcnB family protein [Phenylobacterium sp.]